jgi:hypothetical protein
MLQFAVEILDRPDSSPILAQAIFSGQAAFEKDGIEVKKYNS